VADFNPEVPDQPMQNTTWLSRGAGPNQSMAELFGGIGKAITGVANVGDTFMKNTIEDTVRNDVASIDNSSYLSPNSAPPELAQSVQGIQKLTNAQQQQKITPEYYYGTLASTVQGLRTRFPGYEDYVDQSIQKITGMIPANMYRNALLQDSVQAAATAQAGADKNQEWIRNNAKYLSPAEYSDLLSTGGQKIGGTAGAMALIQGRMSTEAQNAAWENEARADATKAQTNFNQTANQTAAGQMTDIAKQLNLGTNDVGQWLQKAAANGGLDPQTQQQALAALDAEILSYKTAMNKVRSQPGYSMLKPDEINKQIDAGVQPLQDLKTLIQQKQYDQAAQLVANNSLQQDKQLAAIYQQWPQLRVMGALSKTNPQMADTMLNNWLNTDKSVGGTTGFLQKTLAAQFIRGTFQANGPNPSDIASTVASTDKSPAEKSAALGQYVDGFYQMLGRVDRSPQEQQELVHRVYGSPDSDKLWSVVPPDQKLYLFQKMFNPEITQQIQKAGGQAWNDYHAAALNYAQAIDPLRSAAGDLAGTGAAAMRYNPQSGQFEVTVNPIGRVPAGTVALAQNTALQQAAKTLNGVMLTMNPIFDAAGDDRSQATKALLGTLGAAGQPDNFFQQLAKKIPTGEKTSQADVTVGGNSTLASTSQTEPTGQTDGLNAPANPTGSQQTTPTGGPAAARQGNDYTGNPITFSPDALNAIRTDPQVRGTIAGAGGLLNLIGHSEGTDRGRGYNETLANGLLTGGPVNLTDMSISQVYDLQHEMLNNPNNRWNSSAIGRYQIVGSTLRNIVTQLGLNPDTTKFDAQTQDLIAGQIIKNAGYDEWRAGKMSDARFQRNLSGQWASLPNAAGGRELPGTLGATVQQTQNAMAQERGAGGPILGGPPVQANAAQGGALQGVDTRGGLDFRDTGGPHTDLTLPAGSPLANQRESTNVEDRRFMTSDEDKAAYIKDEFERLSNGIKATEASKNPDVANALRNIQAIVAGGKLSQRKRGNPDLFDPNLQRRFNSNGNPNRGPDGKIRKDQGDSDLSLSP
jgi:muramidase (phage lysozyme)